MRLKGRTKSSVKRKREFMFATEFMFGTEFMFIPAVSVSCLAIHDVNQFMTHI